MTSTKRCSTQEWSVIAGQRCPRPCRSLPATAAACARPSPPFAAARHERGSHDTQLIRELLATPPADALELPRDREALRHEAPAALRQAMEIRWRVASVEGRAEYRRFALALDDTAGRAASRGGVLGRSRVTPTGSERDALRSITAILDR